MNRTQAMKEAARLFGKNAVARDYKRPSSPEIRAEWHEKAKALRAIPVGTRTQEERKALNEAVGWALHYRYSIGELNTSGPFAFIAIRGSGDTWEEAFAKIEPLYKKLAA
jgi:hypothetical protein